MKRVISIAALLLLAGAPAAQATEVGSGRNFGLGFQLGDPTALIGKGFLGGGNAIDVGLGFGGYGWRNRCYDRNGRRYYCGGRFGHLSIHGDYLWQENIARGSAKLDWHIGAGGRLHFYEYDDDDWDDDDGDFALAARMPVGLDLTFDRPGFLELFFEIAPSLYFVPYVDFDIDAAIGVRFYF